MSSDSENLSSDSNSSSISSKSIEYREWETRVLQYNLHTDRILEDVFIDYSNMVPKKGNAQPSISRRVYHDREHEKGHAQLMTNYFVDNPTFDKAIFRRRFRMQKHLFCRIVDAITANDQYFHQRPDATGGQGLSSLHKCTGDMRVLVYGTIYCAVEEYLRMSGAVTSKALMKFVQGFISCFSDEFLRKPNEADLARLLYVGEQGGFVGMIGKVMIACIILHNMIVEDERDTYQNYEHAEFIHDIHTPGIDDDEYSSERIADLSNHMSNRAQLCNREAHASLKNDLIEHIWQKVGDDN